MESYEDDDDEPLFADDLDDDPPPLPPPLDLPIDTPSFLSHVSGVAGDLRVGLDDVTATQTNSQASDRGRRRQRDQQQQQQDGQEGEAPRKRKPLLKLSVDRLFSDRGLPYLAREFPKLKFKGKGHEAADLKHLLQQYEMWANTLFPKFTFCNFTDRVEAMGSKNAAFRAEFSRMRRRSAGLPDFPCTVTVEEDRNDGSAVINDQHTLSLTDPLETPPISSSHTGSYRGSSEADDSLAMDDNRENSLLDQVDDFGYRGEQRINDDPIGSASQYSSIENQFEVGLEVPQNLCNSNCPDSTHANAIHCNENVTGCINNSHELNHSSEEITTREEDTSASHVAISNSDTDDYVNTVRNSSVNKTAAFCASGDGTTDNSVDRDIDAAHTNSTTDAIAEDTGDCGTTESDYNQSVVEEATGCGSVPSQDGSHDWLFGDDDLTDITLDQIQDDGDTDL